MSKNVKYAQMLSQKREIKLLWWNLVLYPIWSPGHRLSETSAVEFWNGQAHWVYSWNWALGTVFKWYTLKDKRKSKGNNLTWSCSRERRYLNVKYLAHLNKFVWGERNISLHKLLNPYSCRQAWEGHEDTSMGHEIHALYNVNKSSFDWQSCNSIWLVQKCP